MEYKTKILRVYLKIKNVFVDLKTYLKNACNIFRK